MERLYFNGSILTMEPTNYVDAVLTKDGCIRAVGSFSALFHIAPDAELFDLHGCAMLPAFLDSHGHYSSYAASFLELSLSGCNDSMELADRIRDFIRKNRPAPGDWVFAGGYDPDRLEEKGHPSLSLLDRCAPENPLLIRHSSGHSGLCNSAALRQFGITAETPSPEGGKIEIANGYLEENAFFLYAQKAPQADIKAILGAYRKAQEKYASYGITTMQDGMAVKKMIPMYQALLEEKLLNLDLIVYASAKEADTLYSAFPAAAETYDRHFKLGGCKIFLDGSPQMRTAWMRTPYQDEMPPYFGYPTLKDEEVRSALSEAIEKKRQLLAHCNGDAAAQQFLDAANEVSSGQTLAAFRPVMIHAQFFGKDQLPELKRLGILPSFFIAHVYHFGDTHIRNFGMERASSISPACSALKYGIPFTFHQDAPVIEPDMLETLWCAVNRLTGSGIPLGERERISVWEALLAVTKNAAFQAFEEKRKGSICVGKDADFVILDQDPLAVDPASLRELTILKTISKDRIVYEK